MNNIYVIDFSIDFDISSTFNIDCLVNYKGLDVNPFVDESSHEPIFESPFVSLLSNILRYTASQVDKFLDDKIITTQDDGIRNYLICWPRKVPIDDI